MQGTRAISLSQARPLVTRSAHCRKVTCTGSQIKKRHAPTLAVTPDMYVTPTALLAEQEGDAAAPLVPYDDFFRAPEHSPYTGPSIAESGTLRPGPEWYPEWMKYRRREDNEVFWENKLQRCSLAIPEIEKRWTVFSSLWWLTQEFRFTFVPPAVRYLFFIGWRWLRYLAYDAHKALVLQQCKLDVWLSSKSPKCSKYNPAQTFSKAMALRRLHWKNSVTGEVLYALNLYLTGRIHVLPPQREPIQRPSFFFLF